MRSNAGGNLATNVSRFTGLLFTLCVTDYVIFTEFTNASQALNNPLMA